MNPGGLPDIERVFSDLRHQKDTLLPYDKKSINCEHYATLWKYGIGWSSQVNTYKDIISTALYLSSATVFCVGLGFVVAGCHPIAITCLLTSQITLIVAYAVDQLDQTIRDWSCYSGATSSEKGTDQLTALLSAQANTCTKLFVKLDQKQTSTSIKSLFRFYHKHLSRNKQA